MAPTHGKPGDGHFEHARWCNTCQSWHSLIMLCEHFSDETLAEIKALRDDYRTKMADPEQMKDLPKIAIEEMRKALSE